MELSKAHDLAIRLMEKHNLIIAGWRFQFDNAKRRFGCCKYRSKMITLSKYLTELNNETRIRNTILHEIAHALTPGQHHNNVWRSKAREIGCDGERCYSALAVEVPKARYVAVCPGCGNTFTKHRIRKIINQSCGRCSGGRYNPKYKIEYKLNLED
jgi:predicted SprT family Zn-dependent metalloprotease